MQSVRLMLRFSQGCGTHLEIGDVVLVGTGRRVFSRSMDGHVLDVLILHA